MKQKNDVDSKGWSYYIIWGVALGALLILNYFYFNEHISSNSDTINTYSLRDEDMNKTREAAVAGLPCDACGAWQADEAHFSLPSWFTVQN